MRYSVQFCAKLAGGETPAVGVSPPATATTATPWLRYWDRNAPERRSGSFYDVERCYWLLFIRPYVFGEVRIGLINGSRFCQNIENVCRVRCAVHTLTYTCLRLLLNDVTVCASTSGK